ncbi:MAG TPA: hypothetical protein VNA32_03705 [Actinomycetota bacterium]|nr:hypothetical protein [Actinomycetota bacterium]
MLEAVAAAPERPRQPSARFAEAVYAIVGSLSRIRRIVAAGGGPQYNSDRTVGGWISGAGLMPLDALVVLLRAFPQLSFDSFARMEDGDLPPIEMSALEQVRQELAALRADVDALRAGDDDGGGLGG